jgi:hypothetical protein
VGTFQARCSFLTATKKFVGSVTLCDGIYLLAPGTTVQFAVTGGTGAYEGARGSGTTKNRPGNDNPVSDTTIHLLP